MLHLYSKLHKFVLIYYLYKAALDKTSPYFTGLQRKTIFIHLRLDKLSTLVNKNGRLFDVKLKLCKIVRETGNET